MWFDVVLPFPEGRDRKRTISSEYLLPCPHGKNDSENLYPRGRMQIFKRTIEKSEKTFRELLLFSKIVMFEALYSDIYIIKA